MEGQQNCLRFKKKILKNVRINLKYGAKNQNFHKKLEFAALIYLNIAALHHYPYSLFLYAIGKFMLKKRIR